MNKVIAGKLDIKGFLFKYGFLVIMAGVVIFFSLSAPHFLSFTNFNSLIHAAAPLLVIAAGMAFIVFTGKLDISLGSIAYLSTCIGAVLMKNHGFPPSVSFVVVLLFGALLGAVNGFIVVFLKVNPLITTLGTLTAFRGIGLILTQSYEIRMPEIVRAFGTSRIGGVFMDVWLALFLLIVLNFIHRHTAFGKQVMALGNGEDVCRRLGIRVNLVMFTTFILAGFLSSIGGIMSMAQIGESTTFLGKGMEFTAVAAIVLGGISLFGGEGRILPGVLIGVLTLELIRNGLNHLGANPYLYEFVNGGIIFIAMSADALKARLRGQVILVADEDT
ncbi:MAG: ABC transporter permease [Spirochaetales bacterium]|nr:ABC transporter permease [Spirochaetales bacterium]